MSWDVYDTTHHLHVCTSATWACFLAMKDHWVQQSAPGDNQPSEPQSIKATHVLLLLPIIFYCSAQIWPYIAVLSLLSGTYLQTAIITLSYYFFEGADRRLCWPSIQFLCSQIREKERGSFLRILFHLHFISTTTPLQWVTWYIIFFISSPWFGMDAMKV